MSFAEIPESLRVPGVYVEVNPTVLEPGLGVFPLRALIIGQRTAAGTAPALTPKLTTRDIQAREEHGPGSISHLLAEAFLAKNRGTELHVLSLADIAGTASQGRISFGGAIPAAGILYLYIAGTRLQVLCQTDLDTCATAVVAAINADADLPVTAAIGIPTSDVVLTAKNSGSVANSIDVRTNHLPGEELPGGLTVTITAMGDETAGAGDPDVADVLAAIAGTHYDFIVHPFGSVPANLDVLEVELASRAEALSALQAAAWTCRSGDLATLQAFGDTRNDKFSVIFGCETFPGWDVVRGAAIAGEAARRLEEHPIRPLTGRSKMPGYAPAEEDRFTLEERNLLLWDGISTLRYDRAGRVEIERAITTYQETSGGSPDDTFLDVQKIYGISFTRKSFPAFFAQLYPSAILAEDGNQGDNVVTPADAKGSSVAWYTGLIREGICQNLEGFKQDTVFQISDATPTRLEGFLAMDFTNPLRVTAIQERLRR